MPGCAARAGGAGVARGKPIAETTSVKDTPSTERQPNPPDHRHLWPILALRARRSSNLHLRMRPPPSTDLPVMQPRDTAYLSHLQEASHSNVNNNVKSSVLPLRTSTVGRIAVGSSSQRGLTTRPSRDSREHPNAAHLSHLQEATSISHPTSSSGVYFTFGNSDNTR